MTAIRSADGKFTAIPVEIARDSTLTLTARGLYAYLASLPVDQLPDSGDLEALPHERPGEIRDALAELQARGLIAMGG